MAGDKIFLPKQEVRRGVASYNDPDNRIIVVDRNAKQKTAQEDQEDGRPAKVISTTQRIK